MSDITPAQAAYEAYRRAEVSPLRPAAQALALAGREWAGLDESDRDWWAAGATAAIDATGLEDERDRYRELLDEIGVTAANAPEDGDSFGLLEQIAMRIAGIGVPDSTPVGEWPDPENPVAGRTPGAAAAGDGFFPGGDPRDDDWIGGYRPGIEGD